METSAIDALCNTNERGSTRLKQWHRTATRHDKRALTYLGGDLLARTVIHSLRGTPELGDTLYACLGGQW